MKIINKNIKTNNKLLFFNECLATIFYCYIFFMLSTYKTYSIYNAIPFIASMICMVIIILSTEYISIKNVTFILIMIVYMSVDTIVHKGGGIGSVLIQLYIIETIILFKNIKITERQIKFFAIVLFMLMLFHTINAKNYYEVFELDNSGEILNSNSVAEIVFIIYGILCILQKHNLLIKSKKQRVFGVKINLTSFIIYIILTVITFYIINQCKSRTTLVSFFVFIALLFIMPYKFKKKNILLIISGGIMILGSIYPFVFLRLQQYTALNMWVYSHTGRYYYTGREQIWGNFIKELSGTVLNWLFGVGSHTVLGVSTKWGTNLHNTYWGIILNFGIIGLVLFIAFLLLNIKNTLKNDEIKKGIGSDFVILFLSILIIGWSETILIWSIMIPICYSIIGVAQNSNLANLKVR